MDDADAGRPWVRREEVRVPYTSCFLGKRSPTRTLPGVRDVVLMLYCPDSARETTVPETIVPTSALRGRVDEASHD